MKKKLTWYGCDLCRQFFKKMKITMLLLFVSITGVFATETYAQATKLTLQLNDKTIKEILAQVEDQSEFRFFYNENVNVDKKVSVDVKEKTVFDVLENVLDETSIEYKVIGRQIALYNEGESFSGLTAQQSVVSGKITSQKGESLPGVSVVIKGTSTGTVTNVDGNYSIAATGTEVLIFSFIGMKSQEIPVNNRTSLNVIMAEDVIGVEEVVVIGYGTRAKKDVTTSISAIDSKKIEKVVAMSGEMAMQGTMSGVQVSGNSGNPMFRPNIRIRGINTWGVTNPLYVVDGVPVVEYGAGIEGLEDPRAADVRGPMNIMATIEDRKSVV